MSYDIDGKPLFDDFRHDNTGPAWDPFREYPEPDPEPDDYPHGRPPAVPGLAPHAGTNLRGDPQEGASRRADNPSPHSADMLSKIERSAWLSTTPKEKS